MMQIDDKFKMLIEVHKKKFFIAIRNARAGKEWFDDVREDMQSFKKKSITG